VPVKGGVVLDTDYALITKGAFNLLKMIQSRCTPTAPHMSWIGAIIKTLLDNIGDFDAFSVA